jgi:hypothetical protein
MRFVSCCSLRWCVAPGLIQDECCDPRRGIARDLLTGRDVLVQLSFREKSTVNEPLAK